MLQLWSQIADIGTVGWRALNGFTEESLIKNSHAKLFFSFRCDILELIYPRFDEGIWTLKHVCGKSDRSTIILYDGVIKKNSPK